MFTPPDGQSPLMQMYLFRNPNFRNGMSGDDADVLFHEYTHGLSNRLITDAAEVSTNGTHAVFAGAMLDGLQGSPPTRICLTDLASGDTRVLTFGPNIDKLPKYSPDGRRIAFLSDRRKQGDYQLYFLDPDSGAAQAAPVVEGWVEYFHWSPNGKSILLGVAGHGADVAGDLLHADG